LASKNFDDRVGAMPGPGPGGMAGRTGKKVPSDVAFPSKNLGGGRIFAAKRLQGFTAVRAAFFQVPTGAIGGLFFVSF